MSSYRAKDGGTSPSLGTASGLGVVLFIGPGKRHTECGCFSGKAVTPGTETESEAKVTCAALGVLPWESTGWVNKQVSGLFVLSVRAGPSVCVWGGSGG